MSNNIRETYVTHFQKAMGQSLDAELSIDLLQLRMDLIKEEVRELEVEVGAICYQLAKSKEPSTQQLENMVKELTDVMYVTSGFAVTFGIPCETFSHAQDSNRGIKRVAGCPEGYAYRCATGDPIDELNGSLREVAQHVREKGDKARLHDSLAAAAAACVRLLPDTVAWMVENPWGHLRGRHYFLAMAPYNMK